MESGSVLSHFVLSTDTGPHTKAEMDVWAQQSAMMKCVIQQQKEMPQVCIKGFYR